MSCSVLLRPCSATQPSPGRRHRLPGSSLACSFTALLLGLLLSGAVLWLVRRLRRGATRAADPCRFRLVSRSHTRAGSLRVQHVARCGPRAVHAAHVRAQCHANGHTRVGGCRARAYVCSCLFSCCTVGVHGARSRACVCVATRPPARPPARSPARAVCPCQPLILYDACPERRHSCRR